MGFRRAARKDGNQTKIVEELRDFGYDVDIVHRLKNLYDLIVSGDRMVVVNGQTAFVSCAVRVEVKIPGRDLNDNEKDYWAEQRHAGCLIKAESAEDVKRWFRKEVR